MDFNIVKLDNLSFEVNVFAKRQEYSSYFDKEIKKASKTAKIDGFRLGNVPTMVIKQRYGNALVLESAKNCLEDALIDYLKNNKIEIAGRAIMVDAKLPDNYKELVDINAKYVLAEKSKIDFGLIESKSLNKYKIEVTDEMILESLNNFAKRNGKSVDSDAVKNNDDILKFDLKYKNDEDYTLKDISYMVNGFKDEYKNKLLNIEKGKEIFIENIFNAFERDEKQVLNHILQLENREDVVSESVFLRISSIKTLEIPELTDEFIESLKLPSIDGEIKSIEDLKVKIRKELEEIYIDRCHDFLKHEVYHLIEDELKVDLPIEYLKYVIKNHNQRLDDISEEELEQNKKYFRHNMIVENAIEMYDIKIAENEVLLWEAERKAKQYGYSANMILEMIREHYKNKPHEYEAVVFDFIYDRLFEKIIEKINITENVISLEAFKEMQNQHQH